MNINVEFTQDGEYHRCYVAVAVGGEVIAVEQSSRRPVDALSHAFDLLSKRLILLPREVREVTP